MAIRNEIAAVFIHATITESHSSGDSIRFVLVELMIMLQKLIQKIKTIPFKAWLGSADSMAQTGLFGFAFFALLLTGAAVPVYTQWTGGLPIGPLVLPLIVMGATAAFVLGRYVAHLCGNRVCAWLAVLGALLAFTAFGDMAQAVDAWRLLALRIGLDYGTWHQFTYRAGLLWFGWAAVVLPFLFVRVQFPRAKRILFVGTCCGLIVARILSGVAPIALYDVALAGLLFSASVLLIGLCQTWLTRGLTIAMGVVLLAGWYFGSQRPSEDLLQDVYPFAPIAARDGVYTGEKNAGFTFKSGAVIRTEGLDAAAITASQLIPVLFFPAESARIAVRSQTGSARFSTAETGSLKGQYQAIWVEVPPAWNRTERDYYGKSAIQAVKDHLAPDGILVYDNDGHALDAKMMMTRIAVLRKHFAYVQLWMTSRNHWQLVASQVPFRMDTMALSSLLDREAIATALTKANIETPLTLLSCCFVADTARLDAFLAEAISPKIPRGMAGAARRLLFDGVGSKRLEEAFQPYYDMEMPWVTVPDEIASELRLVLASLRSARILAMKGQYAEASKANPTDPYVQSLAERECFAARAFEKMAEHDKALQLYNSAFAIAQPHVADVLDAATIAQTSGDPERAAPYYDLARRLAPTSPDVLMRQATWQFENGHPLQAEQTAQQALSNIDHPERYPDETAAVMFFIARTQAAQPARIQEGLRLAKQVIEATDNPELKAHFVPLYGQMRIDAGDAVGGVRIKRHWEAYGELLPETPKAEGKQP